MADSLSFDKAEPEAAAPSSGAMACSACQQPISGAYYEVNQQTVCERCQHGLAGYFGDDVPGEGARLFQALIRGGGWALVGAVGYYLFVRALHIELALITIVIGHLIGKSVFTSSGGRGGWKYQLLAAALTYLSVASIYIPLLFEELGEQRGEASGAQLVYLVGVALISPFLGGFENVLGILIIGFGVYRAFSMNGRIRPVFSGPFRVAPGGAIAASAAPAAPASPDEPPPAPIV